jgi:hypothetical protein
MSNKFKIKCYFILFIPFLGIILWSCTSLDAIPNEIPFPVKNNDFTVHINTVRPTASQALQQVLSKTNMITQGHTSSRIDVSQDDYQFVLKDSIVEINLPYFGESQRALRIGQSGILLSGNPKDLVKRYFEEKKLTRYEFTLEDDKNNESWNAKLEVINNGTVRLYLFSNLRNPIGYEGRLVD